MTVLAGQDNLANTMMSFRFNDRSCLKIIKTVGHGKSISDLQMHLDRGIHAPTNTYVCLQHMEIKNKTK